MPPYQAQRQSLYGVGSPAYIRPQIDVGGAIDSLVGAGNSFIHQAFLRRQAENEMALRQGEFQLSQQREARESAAQQRQLGIAERGNEIRAAMAGYTPASTQITEEAPPPAPAAPAPSPAAQISGLPSQAGTTPLTRPVNLGAVPKYDFTETPASYDVTKSAPYVRSMGLLGARQQGLLDAIDRRAADRAPRWVTKVDDKGNYFRENQDTGDVDPLTHPDGSPMKAPPRAQGRSSTAEPSDVVSTRKDLADTNRQQVRAENAVKALKSEQRQIQKDNPRAAGLLPARNAADRAAVAQYQNLGGQVTAAQRRSSLLTQRADSISSVLDQKRAAMTPDAGAPAPSPAAGASAPAPVAAPAPKAKGKGKAATPAAASSGIDPDSITDDELIAAHTAGARTNADVKTYVTSLRARKTAAPSPLMPQP